MLLIPINRGFLMKKFMLTVAALLAASAFSISTAFAATDLYANYAGLSAHYQLGIDYTIETQSKPNDVIILAIHGGRIEKGTDQLAKEIAQDDYSYYIFKANIYEDSNNDDRNDLHLTAAHYDEPTALQMTAQKNKVVSLHGAKGTEPIVYMGGLNNNLMNNLSNKLSAAGFRIETAPDTLNGDDTIEGVQSSIVPTQDEKIRFDFYNSKGQLVLSHSAKAVGHKWFRYSTGLPTGYYKIKVVNVSGHPSWIYGGLHF